MGSQPTKLYRCFNDEGRLLYVGISVAAFARLQQHVESSRWMDDVTVVTIQTYPSREEAMYAERMAVRFEKPVHNKAHAIRPEPPVRYEMPKMPPPEAPVVRPQTEILHNRVSLNMNEAAQVLGVSRSTVEGLIKRGKIAAIKIGKSRIIPRDEITKLLRPHD